jgi:hypothetical protein
LAHASLHAPAIGQDTRAVSEPAEVGFALSLNVAIVFFAAPVVIIRSKTTASSLTCLSIAARSLNLISPFFSTSAESGFATSFAASDYTNASVAAAGRICLTSPICNAVLASIINFNAHISLRHFTKYNAP